MPEITLRYVDCRGRAEPLRHLLRAGGATFTDHREPVEDIRRTVSEYKQDALRGGPFGLLPVLDWGGVRVAQTLPIATFLSKQLGFVEGLDAFAIAREESLASLGYSELTSALPLIVWQPLWFTEVPFERHLKLHSRVPSSLPARVEPLLAPGVEFFGGQAPRAPDFFLFEGLTGWVRVLGEPFEAGILQKERLAGWWRRMNERLAATPGLDRPLTASPFEAEMCSRARDIVRERGLPWPV